MGANIFNITYLFCISILLILIFISFSNFESEAKTVDVTVLGHDANFVKVQLDVYGYVPKDSRLILKIETMSGKLIKKTFLDPVQKSDSMWGAQLLFPKSSSDSDYKISAFNKSGQFLGSSIFSLNDISESTSLSTPHLQTSTYFDKLIITTDKNSYSSGETIVITGEVKDQESGIPVSIIVYAPNNTLVSIAQINVGADKKFGTKITTGGSLWNAYGTYKIKAQYGSSANAIETSFYFGGTTNTGVIPQIPVTQPKITYHNTFLSLQVQDGTSQGYIKVKPTLTYGSGGKLSSSNISIYVDGNYKTKVTSNQWSSNIFAGSGSHTIKASIPELTSSTNNLIKYRASSDTETFFVKAASSVGSTPTPTFKSPSTSQDNSWIALIAVLAIIAVVIIVVKRRKSIGTSSKKQNIIQTKSGASVMSYYECPKCHSGNIQNNPDGSMNCPDCNFRV